MIRVVVTGLLIMSLLKCNTKSNKDKVLEESELIVNEVHKVELLFGESLEFELLDKKSHIKIVGEIEWGGFDLWKMLVLPDSSAVFCDNKRFNNSLRFKNEEDCTKFMENIIRFVHKGEVMYREQFLNGPLVFDRLIGENRKIKRLYSLPIDVLPDHEYVFYSLDSEFLLVTQEHRGISKEDLRRISSVWYFDSLDSIIFFCELNFADSIKFRPI